MAGRGSARGCWGPRPCRWPRRWGVCWPRTSSPRSTCRPSTARTSTASRSAPRRPSAPPRRRRDGSGSTPRRCATGVVPRSAVAPGTATPIATGGMLPRGADAVVDGRACADLGERLDVLVRRPVAPGADVSFAGTDIARGELVLRQGTRLTARETGVLAAIGRAEVPVIRRPRVAILSTGDEILAPGEPLPAGVGLRRQRDAPGRRRPRAGRRARARSASSATTRRPSTRPSTGRWRWPRPGPAQRRDEQGGRRPLLPRPRRGATRASSSMASP